MFARNCFNACLSMVYELLYHFVLGSNDPVYCIFPLNAASDIHRCSNLRVLIRLIFSYFILLSVDYRVAYDKYQSLASPLFIVCVFVFPHERNKFQAVLNWAHMFFDSKYHENSGIFVSWKKTNEMDQFYEFNSTFHYISKLRTIVTKIFRA